MSSVIEILRARRSLLYVSAAWILLWVVPWGGVPSIQAGSMTALVTDMIRLAVALGMFIFPGAMLYALLRDRGDALIEPIGIIPIGFTLSVFLIGLTGLLGRLLAWSFAAVELLFAFVGLLEIVLLVRIGRWNTPGWKGIPRAMRSLVRNPPLVLALLISTLMLFNPSLFFIDDTIYAAYLQNWQHSSHLGFQNLIYGISAIESVRFWLALYPMGQALMAQLSGLPGLVLLSNYLELFLVPIAAIALYWQLRSFGLSVRLAGVAVLIQVSLYTWMQGAEWPPGFWFFQNMAEDKVTGAFILAPVLSVFILQYLHRPRLGGVLLMLFSGLSLTLTHPVVLFYACAIGSAVALMARMTAGTSWRAVFVVWLICIISLAPYAAIRLSPSTAGLHMAFDSESTSYEISRYTHAVNDVFYGLNPGVLQFFDVPAASPAHGWYQILRLFPSALLLVGGILALLKLKQGPAYWFAAASVLLVTFATVPYTGWMLGYFVSARMIARTSWFAPLGLVAVLALKALAERRWPKGAARKSIHASLIFAGALSCCLFVSPILAYSVLPSAGLYFQTLDHSKQLARIGEYIDQNTTQPATVTALEYADMLLLPGVSFHTKLISFREEVDNNGMNSFMSLDEIHQRKYASNAIISLDQTLSPVERCSLIGKYEVRFVVAQRENVGTYERLVAACSRPVRLAFETRDLVLLELQ